MGNICTRRRRRKVKTLHDPPVWEKTAKAQNPRPDPIEYTASKLSGATLIKPPGSLNGLPFVIEECENSSIYLFDRTAQVTADICQRCNILIGPSEGSVFLRNCTDCTLIAACQQFRLRDCKNIDVHLYTFTQPIIETSSGIRLGCFQFYYPSLRSQFSDAGLPVWNNCWSYVFDFNGPNNVNSFNEHHGFLTEKRGKPLDFPLPPEKPEDMDAGEERSVVPLTMGRRPRASNQVSVVVSFGREDIVLCLLDYIRQNHPYLRLVRTRKSKINKEASLETLGNVIASLGWKSIPKEYDSYIALEFTSTTAERGDIAEEVSAAVVAAVEREPQWPRKRNNAGADGFAVYFSEDGLQAEADARNLFMEENMVY